MCENHVVDDDSCSNLLEQNVFNINLKVLMITRD